jgi:predicted permease
MVGSGGFHATFLQDVRYALRQLRKAPGFTLAAVFTLALGIGANSAVFSVMDAVLFRLLPVQEPRHLYYVHEANGQWQPLGAESTGDSSTCFSEPVFEALRQRHDVFDDLIAYVPLSFNRVAIRYGDTPEEAEADEVSGNFFSGLSAPISRGRGFTLEDEKNHSQVMVLNYDYWTRRFSRNPSVLGETVFVKSIPFTVVGITARGFRGVEPAGSTDFWIPLQSRPELNAWGAPGDGDTLYGTPRWWSLKMMARLGPNLTPKQAQNALTSTFLEAAKIGVGTIDAKAWKPFLDFVPARGIEGYNSDYREPVRVLMGLVLLVLLIACTNVALMLVARNTVRQREFSLRLAIGAGRVRLFRQLMTESGLLVIAGAGLGWIFAVYATRLLAVWAEIETGLSPDRNVLLFTVGISALAAVAFGLAPLWSAVNAPVASVLRASSTNLTADRRRTLGGRLVMAAQMAICLMLLTGAGLLLRTLQNYQNQNLGMRTRGLMVFGVTPQGVQGRQEVLNFYHALLGRLRVLPGVESATLVENRPGGGWTDNNSLALDGVEQRDVLVRSNDVGTDFFHVMGIPILQGRDISDADTVTSPSVVVVNETLVRRFFPKSNPLGHSLGDKHRWTIVGVVKDSKYHSADEPAMPMAYYAFAQRETIGPMQIEVRTQGDPMNLLASMRRAVRDINPDIPLEQPMTQQAQFAESYAQPKMFARLGVLFGILAAVLVATGLYGTLSYQTNRRLAEIGVRMALGARREQVVWMVVRESLLLALIGSTMGVPLAFFCARFLRSMLYRLSPFDSLSFMGALTVMTFIAILASLLPAGRAASADPMQALRTE